MLDETGHTMQVHSQDKPVEDGESDLIDKEAIFATFESTDDVELTTAVKDEPIREDESTFIRRSVQLGQAIMHVGAVDPN
jgi:hypothetical protein